MARLLKALGAALAGAVYVWFAAVRNLPLARRRKARRRALARTARERG
jgi:hypothetical protein